MGCLNFTISQTRGHRQFPTGLSLTPNASTDKMRGYRISPPGSLTTPPVLVTQSREGVIRLRTDLGDENRWGRQRTRWGSAITAYFVCGRIGGQTQPGGELSVALRIRTRWGSAMTELFVCGSFRGLKTQNSPFPAVSARGNPARPGLTCLLTSPLELMVLLEPRPLRRGWWSDRALAQSRHATFSNGPRLPIGRRSWLISDWLTSDMHQTS